MTVWHSSYYSCSGSICGHSARWKRCFLLRTFALNLVSAVPLYMFFPVCGPRYAFPDFPHDSGHQLVHPVAISAPPNGVPSGHFSTALLIIWFLRKWPLGQIVGVLFGLLTILATL